MTPLDPTPNERIARALTDLRLGLPVGLGEGETQATILAAETATDARIAALLAMGPGHLAITDWRARTLKARAYDGDVARVVWPGHGDAAWMRAVADPSADLATPLKGPLSTVREGEARAHRVALALCKAAQLLPAALVVDHRMDAALDLGEVDAVLAQGTALAPVVSARLPMAVAEAGRLTVYRPQNAGAEHYGVEIGRIDRAAPVLVRLHSACFTGDVLGSLKCDCGPQLHAALGRMAGDGAGVLLYLNQEGRGIGLANKMRAYSLQDQGFDTVEANHRLGFQDDERDFRLGGRMLQAMGIGRVRLLTNNPAKVTMLQDCGVEVVERVPLVTATNRYNEGYLATKASKSGHIL